MNNKNNKLSVSVDAVVRKTQAQFKVSVILLITLLFSTTTMAIDISQKPLFLQNQSKPNIMFVLDDSGSMDWEILTVPHFEAYNYDRDANRSWARGGWLNWEHPNKAKRNDGDWVSYAGYCHDRNADGICYNRLDLDNDGDDTDGEKAGNVAVAANPNWVLRLKHLYYWEYTQGYCWTPPEEDADASDYLPNIGNIIAFLTGSTSAQAHIYNGTSWGGSNDPANAGFSDTDPVYNYEFWQHRGGNYDVGDWANNPAQATAKATCLSVTGNEWKRSDTGKILHHGPDQHAGLRTTSYPTWSSDPWVSAGSVDNTTGAYTAGNVGGYHEEYKQNLGTAAVAATGSLDINGDGLFNTPDYHERDDWGVKRINYEYLNEEIDNAYINAKGPYGDDTKPWWTCNKGGSTIYYSSTSTCDYLKYADYPSGYPYDPLNSAVAATSPWLGGNQNILTLPSFVPRAIKSSWPNTSIATAKRFDTITWTADPSRGGATTPVGTHHAMNRFDNWPLIADWRIRSADFNVLYYSPDTVYKPWPTLTDANFHAVHSNPQPGTVGYLAPTKDLVRPHAPITLATPNVPYQEADEAGFVYEVWHDDAGFWSSRPQWYNTSNCDAVGWRAGSKGLTGMIDPATGVALVANDRVCSTYHSDPNGIVDLWDKHDRVTVYTDKIVVQTVRRTPHILGEPINSDVSKKYFVSDTRILNTVTYNAGATYPVDGVCDVVLGVDPNNSANCRTVAQVKQNVANWYEFSRRRAFVAKGAIANLITDIPDLRYGLNVTSDTAGVSNLFKEIPSGVGPYATHNADLIDSMYSYVWPAAGTPLRKALQRVGEYFKGNAPTPYNTSPIIESCQKNFALMLTDGYWSGGSPTGIIDQDGDGYVPMLADVAKKYYDEDLDVTMANEVPTDSFNTNNQQHLTTIGIGFGVTGSLVDENGNGWPGNVAGGSSLSEASDWGNPISNKQNKINDLWHAAYNSRGLYLNAKNPAELIARLNDAILFATATVGSASGLTANKKVINTDTREYQTIFKSQDWYGDVIARRTDVSGAIAAQVWSAATLLDSIPASSRKIFTLDASGAGVAFQWATLSVDQQNELRKQWPNTATVPVDAASTAFAKAQLDYLRGDGSDSQFRSRTHILGDIVHSEAVYVDKPSYPYSDSGYSSFRSTYNTRSPMLYVGANDGMLHAIDATTGVEQYAYIPSMLIPRLNSLTHKGTATQAFEHRYFVDATPTSNDAYFDGAWHTVLVGGLGAGGKGIYALDITTTTGATEAAIAADKALWEFSDADDADMGYSFSQPTIVKLNDGRTAAIFGNGYNSANGKAVLYIVDIADGSLIKKIVADAGTNNGLSTPTIIDYNRDYKADWVYAGDLKGNVWRFDISDPNPNPNPIINTKWKVSFSGDPLFIATDGGSNRQPITEKLIVGGHPSGATAGYMVYFGTGKYIGSTDNSAIGQTTQSLYGIWDANVGGNIPRADLLDQKVLDEQLNGATPPKAERLLSRKSINWLVSGQVGDSGWDAITNLDNRGWYLDLIDSSATPLDNKGERIINRINLYGEWLLVDSMLPAANGCEGGGTSFSYMLNAASGAAYDRPPFDSNNDGVIDVADMITFTYVDENGNTQTITTYSDTQNTKGIANNGIIYNSVDGKKDAKKRNDNSEGETSESNLPPAGDTGRKSWIELD